MAWDLTFQDLSVDKWAPCALLLVCAWFWRAEGEKCKSQLQPFLKSLLAADDEKEAAAQTKIEKEHLPIARNLTAVPLIVFLLAASSYDAAYGLQRSSRMQLYLDYSFFGYCCMCIICASRSWISAEVLYYMSALGSILGVAHTFLSEPPSILITAPLKQMLTLSSASILLDGSLAIFSSLVSNVADIAQLLQFECQRGLLPGMVMTELGVTFMAVIPIVLLKECLLKEPEPSTDGEVLFHEHSAARRMLAVLCDAQVYLDQDLSIISHCKGLAQLLMSNSSSKALEGRTFQDFLAPRDKPRFKTFVESAVKVFLAEEERCCEPERLASSSWKHKSSTPTSLQVHVIDSHGLLVAVELFHICVPGPNGGRGHFIGISEAENAMSQASQSDSGSGQSRSLPAHHHYCSENALQEIFAFKPQHVYQEAMPRSESSRQDGGDKAEVLSESEASSESSVTSAAGLVGKMRACPEIEFGEIVVDAFCERLSIREASFRFGKTSREDAASPSLLEWVWPSTREKLHASMSHGVNLLFAPPGANVGRLERTFEPIMFQLPFRMKNSCALVANNVDLSFAKERSSPSLRPGGAGGEEEGVAEEDVLVRLKLSCFMVKKMTPSKPQKIKELEERAKAQADLVKNSSFSSALGDGPRQGAPLKKSSKAPSLSDRSDVLEPIQEVRNLTRRARR